MINSINLFNQNYNINPIKANNAPQKPQLFSPLQKDTVSFTGKKEELVRTIGNVTCPCCGVKMMTADGLKSVEKELSKNNTAQHYTDTLKNYEEYMHKAEKATFKKFETWAQENPKKCLENFMQENRESSLENCKVKRDETFSKLSEAAKSVDNEFAEKMANLTKTYAKAPYNTEEDMKDVRKWIISDVENSENKIADKDKYAQMKALADSLPTSKNSADAFIVRYASQPSLKVANRLLKLSVGTIEHIKPQAKGGRDRIENYLLECGECNHTRGEIPLNEWVNDHPEMKANTQKYIDEVIEKINAGKLKGLENYPNVIKGAISEQSKGTLTFDTSALKPSKGKMLDVAA